MIKDIPRLRIFAGPNGSGKSTIPDEIEKEIIDDDFLDLAEYQIVTTEQEFLDFFNKSSLLEKTDYYVLMLFEQLIALIFLIIQHMNIFGLQKLPMAKCWK